jgi:hypothetical protein
MVLSLSAATEASCSSRSPVIGLLGSMRWDEKMRTRDVGGKPGLDTGGMPVGVALWLVMALILFVLAVVFPLLDHFWPTAGIFNPWVGR